nr:MAG TPA: hypothetical protein [Caudoviricetes sp.]
MCVIGIIYPIIVKRLPMGLYLRSRAIICFYIYAIWSNVV